MPKDIVTRIMDNRRRAKQMASLRKKGLSFREIGDRFGLTRQFVQAELQRLRG